MSIRLTILSEVQKIAAVQNKQLGALSDDLPLAKSGFDSLCFAILVAQLDDDFGLFAANEPGEAIGRLGDDAGVTSRFEGYSSREETERKILRDVFVKGDAWFRTGDLMRRDDDGFFYFVDRIGDTFRWKGENVSAAEVTDVLDACLGVLEAIVYGVTIPGSEGRAGMAALVVSSAFDLADFATAINHRLPGFARPLFLRLSHSIATTATYKPRKQDLQAAGFDPAGDDPIFIYDRQRAGYTRLDQAGFDRIQRGEAML